MGTHSTGLQHMARCLELSLCLCPYCCCCLEEEAGDELLVLTSLIKEELEGIHHGQ